MTSPSTITLFYVHDPMCSWCWGFRPVLLQLKQQLTENLPVINLVGGLAADNDQPMPEALQRDIKSTWVRIQQMIPGTQFNFDFWNVNTPRRSTYPACRAVIAARELANKDQQMTQGIQQAYYLNAKNPSNLDTLIEIAQDIGLNPDAFSELMQSAKINSLLTTELEQVRALGVYGFPSLVIQSDSALGSQQHIIPVDYHSADTMHHTISQLLSELNR